MKYPSILTIRTPEKSSALLYGFFNFRLGGDFRVSAGYLECWEVGKKNLITHSLHNRKANKELWTQ